jgi:hypothetical protein
MKGHKKTIASLLLANIIYAALALFEGWNISILLWIYWFQSLIIGIFHFFELLSLGKVISVNKGWKKRDRETVRTALFFMVHYGGFHLGYAIFLFVIPVMLGENEMSGWIYAFFITPVMSLLIPVGIFSINQAYIFSINSKKLEADMSPISMMFLPYARIMPMHIVIVASFYLFIQASAPIQSYNKTLILIIFLTLKTLADTIMQHVENRFYRGTRPSIRT